jgi:hypothetical protein
MPKTYPEINEIRTAAECAAAIRMGINCYDNVKPEFQQELKDRLAALEERMRRLQQTGKRIRETEAAR